jgi:hypothetical protein|tara:strand:+ start:11708 stop:12106 length:399 start_codon:yes stop_codon:yes gene_type:complete
MKSVVDTLVEVILKNEDDFLKVRETLTRIGIASPKEKRLYQSCHILHKRGKYYITHFKELFALDGKATNFSDDDKGRRNTIIQLLADWGLIEVVNPSDILEPVAKLNHIKIIAHKEKQEWDLITKYNIGKKR